MALEPRVAARQSRAKYEASLEILRRFVDGYPSVQKRVEEHHERLGVIEGRLGRLREELFAAGGSGAKKALVLDSEASSLAQSPATDDEGIRRVAAREAAAIAELGARTVSFAEDASEHRYSYCSQDEIIPAHGHWVPADIAGQRSSFQDAHDFAKQLGGRLVRYQTGIDGCDPVECVLVEPMGKILSPSEYVTTGLVVSLHGEQHTPEVLEEWGEVLRQTKWLDSGMSFAMPNVSMLGDPEDVGAVVAVLLKQVGYSHCVLAGRGWGAQAAIEMAGSRLAERVDGVVLVGPSSPVPSVCSQLECPILLLWAQDDQVSPYSEIRDWCEVFEDRRGPSLVKDAEKGGHNISEVIKESESAEPVLNFTIASMLIGCLLQALDAAEAGRTPMEELLTDRAVRLCDELPHFLASQLGGEPEDGVAAALAGGEPARMPRRMQRMVQALHDWIAGGLPEMASATE